MRLAWEACGKGRLVLHELRMTYENTVLCENVDWNSLEIQWIYVQVIGGEQYFWGLVLNKNEVFLPLTRPLSCFNFSIIAVIGCAEEQKASDIRWGKGEFKE